MWLSSGFISLQIWGDRKSWTLRIHLICKNCIKNNLASRILSCFIHSQCIDSLYWPTMGPIVQDPVLSHLAMSRMFHNIVKLDAMSSSNKPSIALCKTSRPRWPPWPRHEPWTWALKTEIQSNLSPPLWISKYQILFHFDHIKTFQCWRGNIYRLYSCDNLLRFYHGGEYWPSCWCCLWQSWECRLVGNCPVELLTVYIDKAFLQGIGEDLCGESLFPPPCLKLTLVF